MYECLAADDQLTVLYVCDTGVTAYTEEEVTRLCSLSDFLVPSPVAREAPSPPVSSSQAGLELSWMHQQRSGDFFWMGEGGLDACGL